MTIEDIKRRCIMTASGATEAAVETEMLQVIREFCAHTGAWDATETQDILVGDQEFDMNPPQGVEVVTVAAVWVYGRPVPPVNRHDQPLRTDRRYYTVEGEPKRIKLNNPLEREEEDGFTVNYWMRPQSLVATPDELIADYEDAFFHGTLGFLMMQLQRPYTSPGLAQFHSKRFSTMKSSARRRAITSKSYADAPLGMHLQTRSQSLRRGS